MATVKKKNTKDGCWLRVVGWRIFCDFSEPSRGNNFSAKFEPPHTVIQADQRLGHLRNLEKENDFALYGESLACEQKALMQFDTQTLWSAIIYRFSLDQRDNQRELPLYQFLSNWTRALLSADVGSMDVIQQTLQTLHEDHRHKYRWIQDRSIHDQNQRHEWQNRTSD